MRFRRVPVQIAGEVFQFRIVRVQMLCEVPEGSDVFNSISIFWAEALKRSI